jgi:hypothetical protein
MEIQEIEVTIGKDGKVQIHVLGAAGRTCLDLTKGLEQALGGTVLDRTMTAESLEDPNLPLPPGIEIKPGK